MQRGARLQAQHYRELAERFRLLVETEPLASLRGIVTVTTVGLRRPGPVGIHAAATEPCHCAAASALKIRSVDREMRWR